MRILLDTSALSALFRSDADERLTPLLLRVGTDNAFISVISAGELDFGVRILPPSKKRHALELWLARLLAEYRDRLLDVTRETTLHWSAIRSDARRRGHAIGEIDGLIAATAVEHDLAVVTRNARDFLETGARVLDPWQ